jgi:aldose 1-epimerase
MMRDRWRLTDRAGLEVSVLAYGATLQEVLAPGRDGVAANVALGFSTVAEYKDHPNDFLGATIGRYANRIAGGRLPLEGRIYELPRNDRGNCLHGGPCGFDKRVWRCVREDDASVTLAYLSPDGEMGFPGTLETEVTYTVRARDVRIDFRASADAPTVVNLTNHTCWNLAGLHAASVRDHLLQIDATRYTPLDATGIPTGEPAPVAGTPVDFRTARPVGDEELDDNVLLEPATGLRHAATLADPESGRTLEVWTTEPCLQVWTGTSLEEPYGPGSCVALETQHAPDSPNRPSFPTTILRPGDVFGSTTLFRFDGPASGDPA